ncbi:hypothetical protein RF11_01870 [Thelohanellus kitauei]|uniref:Uncharacterized protein n=1 Tax=Thelohanellus kitauei TaxID=669202 RepID=A0A0C2M826_THEKT|nr:hypothetical protein RF11_01870 [Thelohanellus kitauei]
MRKIRTDVLGDSNSPKMTAVPASYFERLQIARAMKLHTKADKLLFPTAMHIVRVMIGEEYVNKLNDITQEYSWHICRFSTLDNREMKSSTLPIFSSQLDESTY